VVAREDNDDESGVWRRHFLNRKMKYTLAQSKRAWRTLFLLRKEYRREHGIWLTARAAFKKGLITHQEYRIICADKYKQRWYGIGKWYKRRLSKARRQEWKTGQDATKWESECDWKGT